jgi:diguanylate cyclase (GGDEF)-like protein/PAS domain S-box-containing protein
MPHSAVTSEPGWFKQLFESSPDPSWIIDGNRYIECNDAAVGTLGYTSRNDLLGAHPSKLSPPRQPDGEDSFAKAERMMAIAKKKGFHRFEWIHSKADGSNFIAEVTLWPIALGDRQVIYCIWRDIAERKQSEQALLKSKQQYDDLVSKIPFGIYVLRSTPEGTFALDYVSPRSAEMFGASVDSLLANFDIVPQTIHPDDRDAFIQLNLDGIERLRPFDWNGRVQTGETVRWLHIASSPDPQENGDVLWIGIVEDITERKQMEDQIRQLAFHDTLTALPNRRLLNDRLRQAMAASERSACYGALFFLDLDNFKLLNDTRGHEVGDLLLIEAAGRLKGCVREMDTVARFGGDEFVVMVTELSVDKPESAAQADIIARKISAELAKPYVFHVRHEGAAGTTIEHCCTASIGVVLFGKDDAGQDDILKWADTAMYQAKESGSGLIRYYDPRA